MAVPGYMTVYRRSALYRVHLTVSIEEQERRGEVQQAQDARWHEDRRVREAAAARARLATEFQHMSEADFRHYICTGLRITGTLLWEHTATSKAQANAIYPYRLPANTYARIRGLLIEVDQLLDQCELERADALQLARADAKFQAFLAGQCIAGEE